jgi:hypothetical protein
MSTRLLVAAAVGGLLVTLPVGHAQDRKTTKTEPLPLAPKVQRLVYPLKGGDPAGPAEAIKRHLRGEVEVSVLPHALVLSGDPAAVQEATKLLDQLDLPVKSVEVEVTIVEVATKGDAPGAPSTPSASEVMANLVELKKAGAVVRQVRFTAVEGQGVLVQNGRNQPVVSGAALGGGRAAPGGPGGGGAPFAQRSVTYQSVGTTVKAETRVGTDGAVTLDLSLQDAAARAAEPGDESGGGAPTLETATLNTRVRVPPGQPILAEALRADTKAGRTTTLVIVTARVVVAK